jgi:Cap4 dsDNA endonuclease
MRPVASPQDPLVVVAPDDTGSSTFARFRYQAYVAMPFAVNCGLGADVVSIIPEHIEDLAIEYTDHWRFIQVKTRDPGLRPWRMSELLSARSGLHSLARGFRAVGPIDATHELWVEGGLENGDPIQNLTTPSGRSDAGLVSSVSNAVGMSEADCRAFLERFRLKANLHARPSIRASVLLALSSQAPGLSLAQIAQVESLLMELLCGAMAAELAVGDDWPSVVVRQSDGSIDPRAAAKRLVAAQLRPLVALLAADPRPLLRRTTDADLPTATNLESKMIGGGATDEIVFDAKSLRAQAVQMEMARAASSMFDGDDRLLADVRERLRIRATALLARFSGEPKPAIALWAELGRDLATMVEALDTDGVFKRDPFILLGEVCEMSDQCLIGWGFADA